MALFKRACRGGSFQGCYNEARALELSQGAPQDIPRAAALYEQVCNDGEAGACTNLGFLYLTGRGVKRDMTRAARPCLQCAQAGRCCRVIDELITFR